ncbi:DUF1801 domain-containing protein [Tundrisphaera sp. TA3]|uniref:DUF1801 domain-containing protein n=1 Tax=Tundrisphaera sp. TA3 TaxID=3435775 RepID=UPI003EBF0419
MAQSTEASKTTRKPRTSGAAEPIPDEADWREATLSRMRALILEADPGMVEEIKWRKPSNGMAGVPTWSHDGIVCTGETYKQAVKLTFARGASLPDPSGLFNSGLDGNARRAIDIREGEQVDAPAFRALIRAAVAHNRDKAKPAELAAAPAGPVKLLSGGNPQIAKADGDAPVQAYIAAMPGWKRGVGERLDAIITRALPDVRKAAKWNSPLYGVEGQGWFLGFHCLTKYVKVAFFRGSSLQPLPPGTSKSADTRYLDIREGDEIDEAQLAAWVRQAASLPGWTP